VAQVFAVLTTADPTLLTGVGRRELYRNAGPHRVVAVLLGAPEWKRPDRVGDARYSDQGRILHRRQFRILWECYDAQATEGDADFTNAETLMAKVAVAIRNTFHNSVDFGEETWIDQQENQDAYERYGSCITFVSTLDIPLYEPRQTTITTLTGSPKIVTTVQMDSDPATTVIDQG
jgi:hypothetical protein